jgi:hypothetical protein
MWALCFTAIVEKDKVKEGVERTARSWEKMLSSEGVEEEDHQGAWTGSTVRCQVGGLWIPS